MKKNKSLSKNKRNKKYYNIIYLNLHIKDQQRKYSVIY